MKKQVVKEWFERGAHDLKVAKIIFAEEEYFDSVLFHTHQAVEKYLKGYLISKGWKLEKLHDLEMLLTEAISFDIGFQKYLDFGRKLTAFYYEDRYPPGPITYYSKEEIEEILDTTERIIYKLKKGTEK